MDYCELTAEEIVILKELVKNFEIDQCCCYHDVDPSEEDAVLGLIIRGFIEKESGSSRIRLTQEGSGFF